MTSPSLSRSPAETNLREATAITYRQRPSPSSFNVDDRNNYRDQLGRRFNADAGINSKRVNFAMDHGRPQTVTVNGRRASLSRENLAIAQSVNADKFLATMRICYVCGQRIGRNSLEVHEKKCLRYWEDLRQSLPEHIRCNRPLRLRPPSLDGTVDAERADELALQSSNVAQQVECALCQRTFALADAHEHVEICGVRRKPSKSSKPRQNGESVSAAPNRKTFGTRRKKNDNEFFVSFFLPGTDDTLERHPIY